MPLQKKGIRPIEGHLEGHGGAPLERKAYCHWSVGSWLIECDTIVFHLPVYIPKIKNN